MEPKEIKTYLVFQDKASQAFYYNDDSFEGAALQFMKEVYNGREVSGLPLTVVLINSGDIIYMEARGEFKSWRACVSRKITPGVY